MELLVQTALEKVHSKILSGEIEPNTGDVHVDPNTRMSVLKQDHFAFDEYEVLETVIMGNKRLYEIMKEKMSFMQSQTSQKKME